MPRLMLADPANMAAGSQQILDAVKAQLGVVPNLFRLAGLSPETLRGLTDLQAALGTTLDTKLRERIALTVAQANRCDYCLSAHSWLGRNLAGLDDEEIAANRRGRSNDARANAAVAFARRVTETRGRISEGEVGTVRAVGFSDGEIIEIVAHVALNSFTNLLNNVAETEVDFPIVRADAD